MSRPANGVCAVVVTYQPDAATLERLLDALSLQVEHCVVVDNASARPPSTDGRAQLIRLEHNRGLAAAQNAGIEAALAAGASWLLLLDQDSLPVAGMVDELVAVCSEAADAGCRIAAAGPLIVDPQGRSEGFVRFRRGRYEAVQVPTAQRWVDCDLLFASGSLIPVAALRTIGPMDEQLFIDRIDSDWSLRAAARNHVLIGVSAARLQHRLGEHALRVWLLGWRHLRQHAPFRYYYMVRNSLLLRRRPYATAAWRRADLRQLLSHAVYFGLLAPGRVANLRMMVRGLVHGLRGTGGPDLAASTASGRHRSPVSTE